MKNKTEKRRLLSKRVVLVALAVLLTVSIAVGLLVYFTRDRDDFDYLNSDLSKYISISEGDYTGYTLEVITDPVTDASVEEAILGLLYKNKSSVPENKGGEVKDIPITLGDKAYIYYSVRIGDEVISAPSYMTSPTSYGVGSFQFAPITTVDRSVEWRTPYVTGFDSALIGAIPSEHQLPSILTSGRVADGDTVVFSYTDDGRAHSFTTTLASADATYGEGMREHLLSAEIGKNVSSLVTSLGGQSRVYNNIKVEYALRGESRAHSFELDFPMNYSDKSLSGKRMTVDVWIRGAVVYNTPEYSSEFITESLGITEQELSKYEGADLTSRHRAMIYSSLLENARITRDYAIEEALWDLLVSRAEVKELPRSEVKRAYEETYSWIYLVYANRYSASFDSAEHFAAAYYGLSSTDLVPSHVIALAEREVKERLILYSIAREKALLPTGDEFTAAYNEAIDEQFKYYSETSLKAELDALTGEERQKRADELKLEMIESLGEAYFGEIVYYNAVYSALLGYGTVR